MTHKAARSRAEQTYRMITVTAGGLYLATHSVTVTALGTAAATVLFGWSMWLTHRSELALLDGARSSPASNEREADPGHVRPLQQVPGGAR